MKRSSKVVLAVYVLLLAVFVWTGTRKTDSPGTASTTDSLGTARPATEAFVTTLTSTAAVDSLSDSYFLSARLLVTRLQQSNTHRHVVVLATSTLSPRMRSTLERDGAIVRVVSAIVPDALAAAHGQWALYLSANQAHSQSSISGTSPSTAPLHISMQTCCQSLISTTSLPLRPAPHSSSSRPQTGTLFCRISTLSTAESCFSDQIAPEWTRSLPKASIYQSTTTASWSRAFSTTTTVT